MGDTLLRYGRIALPAAGASFATNFAPDPRLPGLAGYIPGVSLGERLAGMGGALYDAGGTFINGVAGTNIPPAWDFLHDWGQRAQTTEDELYKQLGGVEPQGEAEKLLQAGASGVGAFAPMGAAGVLGAARAAAPTLLRPVLSLLPSTAHAGRNAVLGAGLGAGGTALIDAAEAADQPTQPAPAPAPTQAQPAQRPLDALIQQATQPTQAAPRNPVQDLITQATQGAQQTPGEVAQEAAPPFSELGKSPYTFLQSAAVLATAIIGVAAGRRMAQMGSRISAVDAAARAADPAYAVKVNDYENSRIARLGNQISQDEPLQAPLPSANVVKTWLTQAQNWGLDAVANIQEFVNLTAQNPSYARRLNAQIGAAFDDQMWEKEFNQFARTGHDPASGVTIPSLARYANDVSDLAPPRQKVFNDTVAARDELNNRDKMIDDAVKNGQVPDPQTLRHNFYHQSRQDLESIVSQGMADPVINGLVVRHDLIGQGLMDIAERRGYLTSVEVRDIKQDHPHFLPEGDVQGRIRQTFGRRVLAPSGGIEQMNTKGVSLMAQHTEALMRDIKMNDMIRAFDDHIENWQNTTPGAPKIAYDSISPNPLVAVQPQPYPTLGTPAISAREQIIPVRRSTGTTYRRYDEPMLYDTLSGQNTTRSRIAFDSAGKWRQILQAGTTGSASLLTGRIVPLRNLLYTAIQAPINAPKGVYGGPVSYLTGGRLKPLTAPLDIPLNVAGALGTHLVNVGSRAALSLSDALRPDNMNPMTQAMKAVIGNKMQRMLSDKLMDLHQNSVYAQGAQLGLGGQSLQQRMRMPLFNRDESNKAIRLQTAQIEPRILINQDKSSGMRPFAINARRAITDTFIHASEATHDFLYRLNRDNPNFDPLSNAMNVRRIVGDPSVSGLGRLPQAIRSQVPYSNVAVQGARAMTSELSARPLNTSLAMVTAYGSLAALSMLSAFQSKDNLQHYTNDLSTSQRAANLTFYNGPNGERSAMFIPMPQEARWIWPIIQEAMFHVLNMYGAAHDAITRNDVLSILKDLAYEHVDKATTQSTLHGLNDAFNFLDYPVPVKLGMAAAGGGGRFDIARIANDAMTGNLGMNTFVNKGPDPKSLPNESPDDAAARNANGKRWSEVLSTIFGLAGATIDHVMDIGRFHAQGNSWLDSVGYSGKDWLQDVKDYNPNTNTLLWENQIRLSTQPPIVEQGQRAVAEMRKTQGGMGTDELREGLTGGKMPLPVPQYPNSQGKVPDDPTMRAMYMETAGKLKYLDTAVLPEIGQIRQQMQAVDAQMLDPKERRRWMNERTRDLADKWRMVNDVVDDLNNTLSQIAGKSVDIRKGINWQGDLSQF